MNDIVVKKFKACKLTVEIKFKESKLDKIYPF